MEFANLKECRQWLTDQGLTVTGYQSDTGRVYRVTNFRGGQCFYGTRQQLIDDLNAGWLRYA